MSLILTCGSCERKMGSLEEHRVRDDKYLCIKCFDALEQEKKAIQNIYDSVPDDCIPWAFGVLKEPDFPYDGILTGIIRSKQELLQTIFSGISTNSRVECVNLILPDANLTSNIIPSPSINNSITFYNKLGQQLSTGTLSSVDFSQAGKIIVITNIVAMFDLMSITKISFTQDNMFSSYSVKLVSNIITTDTHYSFLVQLEFNIV